MAEWFQSNWTDRYGIKVDPNGVWARNFSDVTPKQLARGFKRLKEAGAVFPPTLPQFHKLCVEKHYNDYIEEIIAQEEERTKRLSAPSSKEVAFEHINSIKQHNAKARERIAREEAEREGGC